MLASLRATPIGRGRTGKRSPRALPGLAAVGADAVIREDGAAAAILTLAASDGRSAAARLATLRSVLLAMDGPAQLLIELAPADPGAHGRAHAAATADEPHPRLRRLAHDLRAWAGSLETSGQREALALTVALIQPTEPAAPRDSVAPATGGTVVWLGVGTLEPAARPTSTAAAQAALAERCGRLIDALGGAGLATERLTGSALLDLVGRLGRLGAAPPPTDRDAEGRVTDVA
jgi:hypothetical protein